MQTFKPAPSESLEDLLKKIDAIIKQSETVSKPDRTFASKLSKLAQQLMVQHSVRPQCEHLMELTIEFLDEKKINYNQDIFRAYTNLTGYRALLKKKETILDAAEKTLAIAVSSKTIDTDLTVILIYVINLLFDSSYQIIAMQLFDNILRLTREEKRIELWNKINNRLRAEFTEYTSSQKNTPSILFQPELSNLCKVSLARYHLQKIEHYCKKSDEKKILKSADDAIKVMKGIKEHNQTLANISNLQATNIYKGLQKHTKQAEELISYAIVLDDHNHPDFLQNNALHRLNLISFQQNNNKQKEAVETAEKFLLTAEYLDQMQPAQITAVIGNANDFFPEYKEQAYKMFLCAYRLTPAEKKSELFKKMHSSFLKELNNTPNLLYLLGSTFNKKRTEAEQRLALGWLLHCIYHPKVNAELRTKVMRQLLALNATSGSLLLHREIEIELYMLDTSGIHFFTKKFDLNNTTQEQSFLIGLYLYNYYITEFSTLMNDDSLYDVTKKVLHDRIQDYFTYAQTILPEATRFLNYINNPVIRFSKEKNLDRKEIHSPSISRFFWQTFNEAPLENKFLKNICDDIRKKLATLGNLKYVNRHPLLSQLMQMMDEIPSAPDVQTLIEVKVEVAKQMKSPLLTTFRRYESHSFQRVFSDICMIVDCAIKQLESNKTALKIYRI